MLKICIVGGGASGLTAAVTAACELRKKNIKYDVFILERMDRVGKKILATGNGRCNLTNKYLSADNYYGGDKDFIERTLKFGFNETIEFFGSMGLLCDVDEDGRAYPYSYQAAAVLDVLRIEAARLNVREVCGFEVSKIKKNAKEFVIYSVDGQSVGADKVIVCAGGAAYPSLGSNGTGYKLMTDFGHTCKNIYPALVQLKLKPEGYNFSGIRTQAALKLTAGGKTLAQSKGELLFTEYGVSGICVMEISHIAGKLFAESNNSEKLNLHIDFFPDYTYSGLKQKLLERRSTLSERALQDFFTGMINKKIGTQIVKSINKAAERKTNTLSDAEIMYILNYLKSKTCEITGTMGLNNAQVTGGGILSQEFSSSMESKIINGIYAAGEILDVHGGCGGYNLQWAWATGYTAGKNAAQK